MYKKFVCILVSGIFLVTIFSSINTIPTYGLKTKIEKKVDNLISTTDEVIDQKQMRDTNKYSFKYHTICQGVERHYEKLTKVKVKINRTGPSPYFELRIKISTEPGGYAYIHKTIDAINDIPMGTSWVEFDFPDHEYDKRFYFYLEVEGLAWTGYDGDISWCYGDGDPYPFGQASDCMNGEWVPVPWDGSGDTDFCFITYGAGEYYNDPPDIPILTLLSNPKLNEEFKFNITLNEPDNDKIHYKTNFGDGLTTEWKGPITCSYPKNVTITYTYTNTGIFSIRTKATDPFGLESQWSDPLVIVIRKNKAITCNTWLIKILERFPILNKILNQIIL